MTNRYFVAAIVAAFTAAAHAQAPQNEEQAPITNSKAQIAAQAKRDSKPKGRVAQSGGDINKTPEGGAIGADKAGSAGEKRAESRDQHRRNKDGSLKRRSTQGGTPN